MLRYRQKIAMAEHKQVVAVLNLNCPICHVAFSNPKLMLNHLIEEHGIGTYQAKFLAQKLVAWKRGDVDPAIFPKVIRLARNH